MKRALILALVAGIVAALGLMGLQQAAADSGITVTRDIDPSSVPAGGGEVEVTITIAGAYGIGSVVEKLPAGFSYVEGSVMPSDITTGVDGQDVRFSLVGEPSFTYKVMTSASAGPYRFPSGSKLVYGLDKTEVVTSGDDQVTVAAGQPSGITVTRGIAPSSVPAGGGEVEVTITIAGAYGIGSVVEKLPAGFSYVEGSVMPSDITTGVDGQDVRFSLVGEPSFTYKVMTSASAGPYRFPSGSKLVYGLDKTEVVTSGDDQVTVAAITVTRDISPSSVPAGGGEVEVTITIAGAYGIGSVVEKLPAGFSYVEGSVMPSDITTGVDGQDVSFSLVGEPSFTYKVMTSASAGPYRFPSGSKLVYGLDKTEVVTSGDDQIRVGPTPRPPAPRPAPAANNSPTFPSDMVTYTIEENSPPGTNVGEPVTATDPDDDALIYALSGADAAAFLIDRDSGQITVGPDTSLDYESKSMYTLAVMASDGNGGSATTSVIINLTDVDEAPPADPCVNDLGAFAPDRTETLNGTWAADCASENRLGRYASFFSFTLEEATEVTIELTSAEDTYLYLLEGMGRDGMVLHENDDIVPATDTDSRIQETLVAGTYTIEATTYSVGQMGSFTLTVSGLGDVTTPTPTDDLCRETLSGDGAVTGEWAGDCESAVGARGYARYYTFTLVEESEVTITLESDTDPYLYLREGEAKSGDFLHENDDIVLVTDTNSRIQETLAAGTYTIEATTYGFGETGSFTLTVSGLGDVSTPAPEPTPTDDLCRQTLSGVGTNIGMWASGCESTTRVGSYARYYTFTLTGASEVTITLESDTDPYLYLRSGEVKAGAFLHENDDLAPGTDTNSRIEETLVAGTYTIEATTYSSGETGSFTLTVSGW